MESNSNERNMKCFINMALKKTISWKVLSILLEELTPTFDKSKQLNRILLKELEKVQSQDIEVETLIETEDVSENQDSSVKSEAIQEDLLSETDDETVDSCENDAEEQEPTEQEHLSDPLEHSSKKDFKHKCKTCPSSFKDSWKLKRHETMHSTEKPFKCTICLKMFKTYDVMRVHEMRHALTKYSCKTCSQIFNGPLSLSQHEKVHIHKCQSCNKNFKDSKSLQIHNNSHTGEKPFKCKTCPKRYTDPSSRRRHENVHHKQ